MNRKDFEILMNSLFSNNQLFIPQGQTIEEWIDNAFVNEEKVAINFIPCCTELPTKETINTVASNKALKYAYANEDTYEDYVKAIEEGADYVKNYLTKHK
tara:strand:- start:1111 stop:1410 length:300 start_codon:yes stop_codon:yes gene_type:complete